MMNRICLMLAILIASSATLAHEVRPALLQITEKAPQRYEFYWQTPAKNDMYLALNVILPQDCITETIHPTRSTGASFVQIWQSHCQSGLEGRNIAIQHLESSLTDVLIRVEMRNGNKQTIRVTGDAPNATIAPMQSPMTTFLTYLHIGTEHILFGWDHLLFVLCLLTLVRHATKLFWTVTAFTLAHSITLAIAVLGGTSLATAPMEACIALSILFAAVEIIRIRQGLHSFSSDYPWIVSFAFGLLHGFGFAGALSNIGLPQHAIAFALFSFNLGVELGQLAVIVVVLTARYLLRNTTLFNTTWGWKIPTYGAGSLAGFWFVQRTVSIFS